MAIRGNAAGESLTRTTNLPTLSGFTMMAWMRISVDRNAVSTLPTAGAAATAEEKTLKTATDGTTLNLWNGSTLVTGGTNLVAGALPITWYHVAMVYDGTSSPDVLRAYVNGALDLNADAVGLTDPTGKIWIGDDNAGEWLNGSYVAIKIYSAVLTPAEIQQEMRQIMPARLANLNSWTPGHSTNLVDCGRDYSGAGNNWTQNGTLNVDQVAPPVPWKQGKKRRMVTTVAGGVTFTPGGGLATLSGAATSLGFTIPMPKRQ